jgi:hypothetical protein
MSILREWKWGFGCEDSSFPGLTANPSSSHESSEDRWMRGSSRRMTQEPARRSPDAAACRATSAFMRVFDAQWRRGALLSNRNGTQPS